jgi:hypothetical protein
MVEAHKGSVQVESDIKKGTSFIINVPKDPRLSLEVHSPQIPQVQKDLSHERSQ